MFEWKRKSNKAYPHLKKFKNLNKDGAFELAPRYI